MRPPLTMRKIDSSHKTWSGSNDSWSTVVCFSFASFFSLIHSFPHFTSPRCWSVPRNRRAIAEEVSEVEEDEVDTNDVAKEEEMDFSFTHRPATRLDELFPVEDEEDNEEGGVT